MSNQTTTAHDLDRTYAEIAARNEWIHTEWVQTGQNGGYDKDTRQGRKNLIESKGIVPDLPDAVNTKDGFFVPMSPALAKEYRGRAVPLAGFTAPDSPLMAMLEAHVQERRSAGGGRFLLFLLVLVSLWSVGVIWSSLVFDGNKVSEYIALVLYPTLWTLAAIYFVFQWWLYETVVANCFGPGFLAALKRNNVLYVGPPMLWIAFAFGVAVGFPALAVAGSAGIYFFSLAIRKVGDSFGG